MNLLFHKCGILTTVQDLGRNGYRRFGINPSGAMDQTAARLANIILGNDENESVIEMHFPAPRILFEKNAVFSIARADLGARLEGDSIGNWQRVFAKKDSVLDFANRTSGHRAYLAVKGGLGIDKWLGSRSTNLAAGVGGFEGRKITAGDRLVFKQNVGVDDITQRRAVSGTLIPRYSSFPTVRIIAGAEFENLDDPSHTSLIEQNFTISKDSDRMGFRLSGEPLKLQEPTDMLSSAVSFGTIQLLPNGQIIVLMADHQTSGGYPRIGHVISRDLPLLAQLGTNDKVAFHLIDVAEAEALALQFERELNFLKVGCRLLSK